MILDLIALEDNSKVWLFQADSEFSYQELEEARQHIFGFLKAWTAHSQDLTCYGNIFHKRFLGIFVDESNTGASGCSIDSMTRFVESLGNHFGKDFFDRMTYAYMDEDENIHTISHALLSDAYAQGQIDDHTLFFDNLVTNKESFLKKWLVPLKDSWHSRFV